MTENMLLIYIAIDCSAEVQTFQGCRWDLVLNSDAASAELRKLPHVFLRSQTLVRCMEETDFFF